MKLPVHVTGYNKSWVFVEPTVRFIGLPKVRFTMPRPWLSHGFAQYDTLMVDIDVNSIHHNGHGWVADMEIISGIEDWDTART